MLELTPSEAKVLSQCVTRFTDAFRRDVADVIRQQFRGYEPPEVTELIGQLSLLGRQIELRQPQVQVHDTLRPLLKRVLIDLRRESAAAIEEPLQKAVNADTIRHLGREVHGLEQLMAAPWFAVTGALRVPRLTDYMSIRHAEAVLPQAPPLHPREYDEKFHILEAPGLFLPDLAHYRARCALRGASIAVAFIDIDDFKAFNVQHTETAVDLHVLPPFMESIEAHVFAHGHAYRFGGDEYLITLPNASRALAVDFLRALQERLSRRRYRRVERAPTISAGLCVADVDCFLTDREIQGRANLAKNHAKAAEKGRIATYDGELFRPEDLVLV
ncbi:GGDEF domain-containing protein [Sorangium sp. So ce315]|uniref:diguanylate cyclase n=1 Tax=Sorangium sp. So ce315 TaxID=3133299 RepID=UPI003F6039F6